MATHSSVLAWKISQIEEPGGYSPSGYGVGHDRATESIHTYTHKTTYF